MPAGGEGAAADWRTGWADPERLLSLPFCSRKMQILGLVPVAPRGSLAVNSRVTVLGDVGRGKPLQVRSS